MAEGLDDKLDGFDVPVKLARAKVNSEILMLSIPALRIISASLGVPFGQFIRVKNGNKMDVRYLPVLYNRFYGQDGR